MKILILSLLVAASAFLCSCASPKLPPAAPVHPFLPTTFEMSYMPSPLEGGGTTITLEKGYLVKRSYELRQRGNTYANVLVAKSYLPTEGQWREFWQEMERIRIWEWKKEYNDKDTGEEVYDGGAWHLVMTYREKAIDTFGNNSGPKTGAPKKTVIESPWQERLSDAILRLTPEA